MKKVCLKLCFILYRVCRLVDKRNSSTYTGCIEAIATGRRVHEYK